MRLPAALKPFTSSALGQTWLAAHWMGAFANWPLWERLHALPELGGPRGLAFGLAVGGMVVCVNAALLSVLASCRR